MDEAMKAIHNTIGSQLAVANYIAEFLINNLGLNMKPDELVGPVMVAGAILMGLVLFLSLSIGSHAGVPEMGQGQGSPVEGEKKGQ